MKTQKKTSMTVSDLARQTGASPHLIRFYTGMGLLRPTRNARNGYRLFGVRDAQTIRFIHQAKSLGFTLREIGTMFRETERGRSPCRMVRETIVRRITENRDLLNEMLALQNHMEQAHAKWAEMPDCVPDGHTVCHLIESMGRPSKRASHTKMLDLRGTHTLYAPSEAS